MATVAQVTANRANAHLSTGPRSVEGKAASSRNSLKLGITAQSTIIPGEDPADLDQLAAQYEQEFQPVGPVEAELLETLIRAAWMQKRYTRIEAEYIGSRLAALPEGTPYPLGVVMAQDAAHGNTLHKIFRRQQTAQRDWYKALEALNALQLSRLRADADVESAVESETSQPNRVRFDNPPQAAPTRPADPPVHLALRL
jgi:hypothetical protein